MYIAMSLDGYIADKHGRVDWLCGHDDGENADTYSEFIREVDTVVMGWNTYHQITTELSPNEWVYEQLTSYVITHRAMTPTDNIKFVSDDPCVIVKRLRDGDGKTVWICGGGNIVQPLIRDGLIDEYRISVIPTVLGSGIRLFGELSGEIKLKLMSTQVYNGITELIYVRR